MNGKELTWCYIGGGMRDGLIWLGILLFLVMAAVSFVVALRGMGHDLASEEQRRAVQRVITLKTLNALVCSSCGNTSDDRTIITRAPCEACGRVICWECKRQQEHGSLHDFQSFLIPSGFPAIFTPPEQIRLSTYLCPHCYRPSKNLS